MGLLDFEYKRSYVNKKKSSPSNFFAKKNVGPKKILGQKKFVQKMGSTKIKAPKNWVPKVWSKLGQ